ncbi:hypothetical protein MRX96_051191 [Rhipicephalus microplus]
MTQRHSPFALLQILLLAALGQSPLVTSAQLFVPFERDWRTGVCPVFDAGHRSATASLQFLWQHRRFRPPSGFLPGNKGLLPLSRPLRGVLISARISTPLRATTPR